MDCYIMHKKVQPKLWLYFSIGFNILGKRKAYPFAAALLSSSCGSRSTYPRPQTVSI